MVGIAETKAPPFRQVDGDKLMLNFHVGQAKAWDSVARFIMLFGGTQVGKTVFGPHWMEREIRTCGPGDYLAVTATYPLLKLKMLPEYIYVFDTLLHLAKYNVSDKVLYYNDGRTRIIFGSATNPESIESATAKAAHLDELGQKQFRRGAWEAVRRRLSLERGRVLGTTTLYGLGWLKTELYDPWLKGDKSIDVIQVDSIVNPEFSREEYDDAKARLPAWKFNLFYRGRFDRPAGLIYDSFDDVNCIVKRFPIPGHWLCFVGMDFGGVNTAAMFYAKDPETGYLYAYRSYLQGGKAAEEHALTLLDMSSGERIEKIAGGAHHEDGWREAFTRAGLAVKKPKHRDVEYGIDQVYAFHKFSRLFVFDDLYDYIDEKLSYSRALDDNYQPTEKIEDKERFHLMDAERYIISDFEPQFAKKQDSPVWVF